MRSLLFVPGDSPRKLEKGLASAADILLIDLEDSVALAAKPEARSLTAETLSANGKTHGDRLFVRVNALDTGMTADDLDAVMTGRPAGIMLPKCASAADVMTLDAMLIERETAHGLEPRSTALLPIITETAAAVLQAHTYAAGLPRLAGLTWGAEDLSADIGARSNRTESGVYTDPFRLARAVTLLAAHAAGTAAVDTVFPAFSDMAGFERECIEAERDGFTAKMAIHPAQVDVINRVFTPSAESIAESRKVIDAFEAAGQPGVVGIDGKMYDRPHLRRAERILARAEAAGAL
ncbi:CoA ester lyase [Zhengella mangrovi]|uniref:CoA ester lyase n=1 Tax=Zhengella mangrovi TaxID=1982044 RepID=A0A2G1QHP4_9HYPH|nr:CoA ester lyase [Zhengella mangrovi]PHP65067.1 CoA ester lyase [Zhengella mangrovi]